MKSMFYTSYNITLKVTIISALLIFTGCKKFIEIDGPITSVNSANIYEKDVTAASVLTGVYTNLSASGMTSGSITSISYLAGLSADELTLFSANENLISYYANALNTQKGGFEIWDNVYPVIYVLNSAIEGVSSSNSLSPAVKQQLIGEAKFMRAFCFFYLTNLYGDIPLVLTTDYKVNAQMPRTPMEQVYERIILDLEDAQNFLSSEYLDADLLKVTQERVRPTKWAANALLARVYLYTKHWKKADELATSVINNNMFQLVDLGSVFNKNNREAIWQIQPASLKGYNTKEAGVFIINPGTTSEFSSISESLLSTFDTGDQRKTKWINFTTFSGGERYYYPFKYKIFPSTDPSTPVTEYSTIFRLAEQYLIRAEARIQQGNVTDGIEDLNVLRERATDKNSIPDLQLKPIAITLSKGDALLAVEKERQNELFTEGGHRWLDLKRTGRINEVMTTVVPLKATGKTWKTNQALFPVPVRDILLNKNLIQNQGY